MRPNAFRPRSARHSDIRPPIRQGVVPSREISFPSPIFYETPRVFSQPSRPRFKKRRYSWPLFFLIFIVTLVPLSYVGGQALSSYVSGLQAEGENGYRHLLAAVENIKNENFDASQESFTRAHASFEKAGKDLLSWKGSFVDLTRYIPGITKAASGKAVIDAGRHIALAGLSLSAIAEKLAQSKGMYEQGEKTSLLAFLDEMKVPVEAAHSELHAAQTALEKVMLTDLPEDKREQFLEVRKKLPVFVGLLDSFATHEKLLYELLGGNGPRKYLFLLQNNHELRATGGFIGSYALLDMKDGVVRQFFVDGIFNPDGQLKENIVPPSPIQKISAGWSLHDSNWFPDFPVSAEKAIFFYEKTGGPTVDGVMTLTPTVMQKLLAITGPIELPQYGFTVDADNFIPVIQEQVEMRYDRVENRPKKVLADLSGALIEKVFSMQDKTTLYRIAQALNEGLNEKHALIYMRHAETQALIDQAGWSGRVLETPKDYLSVIHSNINGYKTDGVIQESIRHRAEIAKDGSIINTVSITRTHTGGHTPYEWWNKVNADYLRVYVPQGSELISAKGATWEFPEPPLDYDALKFRRDADVEKEENGIRIHAPSGTRVYEDAGKTVFGAWVYVSPQESVTVEYRYRLPFSLELSHAEQGDTDSYGVLFQKQAGTLGSKISSTIQYPEQWSVIWQTDSNLIPYERELRFEDELKTDTFVGIVFGNE